MNGIVEIWCQNFMKVYSTSLWGAKSIKKQTL